MTIGGRQPAFWIGLAGSIVVAVLGVLTGQGVITDAVAGKINDATTAIVQLLTILVPVIAGLVIRTQVTPVSSPALPAGTVVTVTHPVATTTTTTLSAPPTA